MCTYNLIRSLAAYKELPASRNVPYLSNARYVSSFEVCPALWKNSLYGIYICLSQHSWSIFSFQVPQIIDIAIWIELRRPYPNVAILSITALHVIRKCTP